MAKSIADARDRWSSPAMEVVQLVLGGCRPRDFRVRLWDGTTWEPEPGQRAGFTLVLHHPGALRKMFLHNSELSLGEAYIHGDFDLEGDMESSFALGDRLTVLRPGIADRLRCARQLRKLPPGECLAGGRRPAGLSGRLHSPARDRKAVRYHYDLSNAFYALWLDRRMVYSTAYFADAGEDLDTAQERKLEYICRKLRLRAGERLLDIGCGWGGLILYAAKTRGVDATGITLSAPQAELAAERIREEGLGDRCRVEVRDYREVDEPGAFDKIASVGMVEHVGESRLAEYFAQAFRLLRPGGVFLNHGIATRALRAAPAGPSFVDQYVFPDGELVPISTNLRAAEHSGFEVRDVESLREHYLLTLRQWLRRLDSRFAEAVRLTDEVTCRTWRLYLSGAAYRFRVGDNNVFQSLLVKPDGGSSGLPLTRGDWYG